LRKENEELVDLLDNLDHMLREAKKLRKELRALFEDARTRVAELETQVLDGKLELILLRLALWFLIRLIVLITLFSYLI
jgi:predicted  nucleic acid-binding Zn-ribbon protein